MSAWITVAITFERLLAVAVPLKVASLSTPCRARVLIAILCVLCVPSTSYPLWTVEPRIHDGVLQCLRMVNRTETYNGWMYATNLVGSLFVPSTFLFVFTFIIFVFLGRSRQLRRQVCKMLLSEPRKHEIQNVYIAYSQLFHSVEQSMNLPKSAANFYVSPLAQNSTAYRI